MAPPSPRIGIHLPAGPSPGAAASAARGRYLLGGGLGLAVVVLVAAVLRLPGLVAQGRFEFDQAGDLFILQAFVHDGVVPLLGPKASVGDFHHGALTFFLLAPAAWLSGSDPTAVTIEIALLGIAAVGATWWMGRVMGGPIVGFVAGLLLAVSPSAIDESSFIWNPNPIPLFAAISAGAAWKAHQGGPARWWILALGAAGAVAQLHVLGLLFVVPVLGLLILDLAHSAGPRSGTPARRAGPLKGLAGGAIVVALLYVPLAIHELQTGFGEVQAVLRYLAAPGSATLDPPTRLLVTTLRVIAWPFVGLVTDAPLLASLVVAVVIVLLAWSAASGGHPPASSAGNPAAPAAADLRPAARWLGLSIVWTVVGLTFAAPTLASVVPGLPNDHYHAFADPLLLVGVAIAGVRLGRRAASARPAFAADRRFELTVATILACLLAVQVGIALARRPGPDPNGGWPGAAAAGRRVVATTGANPIVVAELPSFEPADAVAFGAVRAGAVLGLRPPPSAGVRFDPVDALEGGPVLLAARSGGTDAQDTTDATPPRYLVLGCDRLFDSILGADCGGAAEDAALSQLVAGGASNARLVDRFDASARWSISVYELARPGG